MLHSIILGQGKPFLILHGFLGMADNWKTLGNQWSEQQYQVHLLDQRNHGRSFHSDQFNYQILAQDIKDYCEQHKLKDIILLGHSMGGKVAMECAARFPDLISKLIVADIAPKKYPAHHGAIFNALQQVDLNSIKSRKQAAAAMEDLIPEMGVRQFLLKSLYRDENKKYQWRFNLKVLAALQDSIGAHTAITEPVVIPTLFIRGSESGYVEDKDRLIIDSAFAKAQLKTINGAGHWLHAQEPAIFYELVMDFISE